MQLDKAAPMAGGAKLLECELEFERTWLLRYRFGTEQGTPMLRRWKSVESLCASSGNATLELASIAEQSSATPGELDRIALLRRALERSKRIGGSKEDGAALDLATALRKSGQPVEAAKLVEDRIRAVLRTLMDLQGGRLSGPEASIDKVLLARVGINPSVIGAVKRASRARALLLEGHRRRLAELLRHWAEHFEPESYGLAGQYRAVARRLEGNRAIPDNESPEQALDRKLANAGTSLDQLRSQAQAPSRSSGMNVAEAYRAMHDWFFALDAKDGKRKEAAELALKTATWLNSPVIQAKALRMSTIQKAYQGCGSCFGDGLVAIQEATNLVELPHEKRWHMGTHAWLLLRHGRLDDALPVKKAEIDVLRDVSEVNWIDAMAAEARRLHGRDDEAAGAYAKALADMSASSIAMQPAGTVALRRSSTPPHVRAFLQSLSAARLDRPSRHGYPPNAYRGFMLNQVTVL